MLNYLINYLIQNQNKTQDFEYNVHLEGYYLHIRNLFDYLKNSNNDDSFIAIHLIKIEKIEEYKNEIENYLNKYSMKNFQIIMQKRVSHISYERVNKIDDEKYDIGTLNSIISDMTNIFNNYIDEKYIQ
ncbi:MAG: hypothetical protein ABSG15_04635 [FCB group bacterium]